MTLGTELAEHRYPDSPRRIRVLRCQRELQSPGSRSCGSFLRNRHDNPLSRVSVTLSTESHQSRPSPGIRCAATLLAAFSSIRKKSRRHAFLGRPDQPPRIRQPCANPVPRVSCDDHTREPGDFEMKGLSTTLQPSTDQPERDRTAFPWPAGRAEPSHQSVSNPLIRVSATLQLQVRDNVSGLKNASLPATPENREHRKWQRNDTPLKGSTRMIRP